MSGALHSCGKGRAQCDRESTGRDALTAVAVVLILILTCSASQVLAPASNQGGSVATIEAGNDRTTVWRMYDFFEEPFGAWWSQRIDSYGDTYILHDSYPYIYAYELGNYEDAFNYPDLAVHSDDFYQLSAPYRLNITAENVKEWNTSGEYGSAWDKSAMIIPIRNNKALSTQGNITFDWYWQYLDTDLWDQLYSGTHPWNSYYGIATHDLCDPVWDNDGWYGYLKSQISFDRDAAEKYLDAPNKGDLVAWYNTGGRGAQIQNDWGLYWEGTNGKGGVGNYYWDTFTAYEYELYNDGPYNVLNTTLSTPDRLVIDTFLASWGWEAFMMRILDVSNVTPNFQVSTFEDAHFSGNISADGADINFDAVTAYSLTGWGYDPTGSGQKTFAWMIESSASDYVSNAGYGAYPPDTGWWSDYENYSNTVNPTLTRECELPGTINYGRMSSYWSAPMRWNLSSGETIIIELPPTSASVIGYNPPPSISFNDISQMTDYEVWGNMTYLGGDLDSVTSYYLANNTLIINGPAITPATYNASIPGCTILDRGFPAWYFGVNRPPDLTPPTTTINLTGTLGDNGWYISTVEAKLYAVDDPDGWGVGATKYRIDNGTWLFFASSYIFYGDGIHSIDFYSIDNASNSEAAKRAIVKVDRGPPTISINQENGLMLYSKSIVISWNASDATSGIGRYELSLDGADFETLNFTEMEKELADLPDGFHYVTVRAVDNASNAAEERIDFWINVQQGGIFSANDSSWIFLLIAIVEGFIIVLLLVKQRKKDEPDDQKAGPS